MPVSIHGKTYYTVAERVQLLKDVEYSLISELIRYEGDECIVKSTLTIGDNTYTGMALEVRGDGNINKKSHVENAETSAHGRALSAAGYAGDGSEFCSLNEIQRKAPELLNKTQDSTQVNSVPEESFQIQTDSKASEKQVKYIYQLYERHNVEESVPANISKSEASAIIEKLSGR